MNIPKDETLPWTTMECPNCGSDVDVMDDDNHPVCPKCHHQFEVLHETF